jgi:hypothetical protein
MANGYVNSTPLLSEPVTWLNGSTLGRVGGHSRMAVYGHRATPVAGDDIWEGGGAYPLQSSATKLEILSASANDTAAGTGARTFTISGLDANLVPFSETVTMNGVTPVQTVNSYLRVNGLTIASSGSGGVNAGDVTLRVTGAGATQAIARAGFGYAKQCVFTVPANTTLLVTDVLPECGGVNSATAIVMAFTRITPNGSIIKTNEYNASTTLLSQRNVITGAAVPAGWTVSLRVSSVVGTPVDGYASINGILVDNTQLT